MDIVVIGAGVIGASIARQIVRAGTDVRVTVLDPRAPGRGASQASAGVLAPYIEAHEDSPLLSICTRSLALYDEFIAGVVSESGRQVEYARTGTLEAALGEGDVERLRASHASLNAASVASEWLDAVAAREREPMLSSSVQAALFVPSHGYVNVRALVSALVDSARFAGATFESPVGAVEIRDRGTHVEVRTDRELRRADKVVLAAGSWSDRVRTPGLPRLPVRPVRGQLLQLVCDQGGAPGQVTWGPRCYIVPWFDGSLLVGATMEDVGFDERSTVEGVSQLLAAALELLPASARASVEGVRVGLRPALPDGLPAIGAFDEAPRVIVAAGHFRNGILLAPLTAQMVSAMVLGLDSEDGEALSPERFRTANRP